VRELGGAFKGGVMCPKDQYLHGINIKYSDVYMFGLQMKCASRDFQKTSWKHIFDMTKTGVHYVGENTYTGRLATAVDLKFSTIWTGFRIRMEEPPIQEEVPAADALSHAAIVGRWVEIG
jgi:hypothetical protein